MSCPNQGQPGADESPHREQRGDPRTVRCASCDATLTAESRFCNLCGTPVPVTARALTRSATVLPGTFANGRYQVTRFLGEGGKKKVYLVYDTLLDRDVAFSLIKTDGLDEVGVERIRREAKVMGRLSGHPHIVSVFDTGEEDGQPFLVSELMSGGDVEGLIARSPQHRPPLAETLRIADQVCLALTHAHAHGVVHRDLKPGNVWLTGDGTAKLGDFGLAMAIDKTRLSVAGMIVGTVGYMSPEQALGRTPDARSDLYAFGAMLYELVTGRPPFLGDDPVAVITQHLHTAPVGPSWHNPALPKPLERLILRLLAKDQAERPESAAAVRQELASITFPVAAHGPESRHLQGDSTSLDRLAGGVFVGREQELEQLRGACDAALAGRAGVVMLAGEPGIGKTTISEETVTYARLRGAQVLWGHCYEWEGAPAYWPWVQVVRGYLHAREPQQLRTDLGSGAADIAQVVSEVREQFPDLPELPRMEAEQARFRLFDSIATFFRNATSREPLLVVLDDLHWADTPSLLLLQFVARELERARLLIIGTYRDVEVGRRHPLSATLAELARGNRMARIPLQGLTTTDIERFIVLSTGIVPEPALVAAVQRETEGNPFFVSEVVRLLVAEGRLGMTRGPTSWSFSIPQSVRDVVGRRLDRLSDTCNEVLAIASVVGREFTLPVIERVVELAQEVVLDALEEAAQARLVHQEEPAGRYRFTHALVQETLYAELTGTRRFRFHAAVGQALEQIHAASPAPHYGELAHHFALAAPAGHAAKAIEYSIKAGDRAVVQLAWETAIQHYDRALQVMDLDAEPRHLVRCDVLLALGEAQYRTVIDASESPRGRTSYLRAAEIAKAIGSPERLARAALGFAGVNVIRTPDPSQQIRLLEEALAVAPEGDSDLKARLLARLALDYRMLPDMSGRIAALSDEAMSMARRLGEPAVLAPVLVAAHVAGWGPDRISERLAMLGEAERAAEACGDLYHTIFSQMFLASALYEAGDNQALDQLIDRSLDAAKRSGMPYFEWAMSLWEVGRAIKEGRFATAEASATTLGGDSRSLVVRYFRALLLFILRRDQGRAAELEAALRDVIELANEQVSPFDRYRGHIADVLLMILLVESEQMDEARKRFEAFTNEKMPSLPKDPYWLATTALLGEVCVLLDDRTRAPMLYDRLLPYADHNVAPASSPGYFGAVAHYLGLLATLLARWDVAASHFEDALAMNVRMKAKPGMARTRVAYARSLLARGRSDDRGHAVDLLSQAKATADELGMAQLAAEAVALREQMTPGRRGGSAETSTRFNLSERELEVLRLLAAGRTNPEIAEALYISRATARTHVDNILGKLGVHTRTEAADVARRNGLLR